MAAEQLSAKVNERSISFIKPVRGVPVADDVNDLSRQAGASCFVLVRRPGKLAVVLAYGDENGQFTQAWVKASRVAQGRIDGPQRSGHLWTVQPQPTWAPQPGEGPTLRVAKQVKCPRSCLLEG